MHVLSKKKKNKKNKNKNKKNRKKQQLNNDGNLLASAIEEHLTHLISSAVIKRFLHMDKTDIGNHENVSAVILFGAVYYNYIG